ncbi:alkaline phosphatase family protein, partial [Candidatus Microgenomates bacterium]|nr:alkaline phosphatase family protein [Candidatus Microgenomates bacterium]
ATYDQMPEMAAREITDTFLKLVIDPTLGKYSFVLINFANPDMVGHTGVFSAVVSGVEKVDHELKLLCDYLSSKKYIVCVTADHGNADIMYDVESGTPHTAHTLNPVPFIIYDSHNSANQHLHLSQNKENGLHMIAGTVLNLMELGPSVRMSDTLIV